MPTPTSVFCSAGTTAVAFMALAFAGTEVTAQTIPSPYAFIEGRQEAGAFVGRSSPGTGRYGFGPGSGTLMGARYAIEISGPFSVEGVAGYLPARRDVVDPTAEEGQRTVGEADVALTMVDARLKFSLTGPRTWNRLGPYVLVGGGAVFDVAGRQEADEVLEVDDRFEMGTSFQGVLGGGVRWFPAQRLLLRADATLLFWRLDTPRGYFQADRDLEGVPRNEWVSAPSITLGAAFRF